MKRLILLIVFLFIVSLSYAANKMSMVTYFPVPYVAYSQVSADQQLDVGLTSTCKMNLGCSQSNTNLKANTVNLKGGKLELNQGKGILGDSITLGSTNGTGQIQFKDVRIQDGDMQSVNADTMNVQTLNLFGKPFPSCKEKDGKGQMKWQSLRLQGASGDELYLVCGKVEEFAAGEECTSPEPASQRRVCSTGQCGWQYSQYNCVNGEWRETWGECETQSDPLGDVHLLYQAKAVCCPLVSAEQEFEYLSLYELPSGATRCYKANKLDEMRPEYFARGSKCPIEESGTQGCPGEECDARDIFEIDCLNFMELNEWCYIEDKTYFLHNHGGGYWSPLNGTASFQCTAGGKNY